MRLKQKVAIITGGASGLGRETCLLFAREGAKVVVADYNREAAEAVVEEIQATGGNGLPFKVDVSRRKDYVDPMVEHIMEAYGRIDILVNNAGVTADATLLKMSEEQFDRVINVNLKGVFNCTSAVVPHMVAQKEGRIINTSSIVGLQGNFGQTNYAAAKGGVISMTRTWAKELGPKGITSNAVAPGFITTPMTAAVPEKILHMMEDKVPLKRLGIPMDIANTYLFLASDEAAYINGAVISVDGGLTI